MFEPGSGILFMKVGTHAQEDLGSIIERKRQEIEDAGLAMWGYGGNTCHPTSMVQPFANAHAAAGRPIVLAMQPMTSKHFAEPLRAAEYSPDGISWAPVPDSINVLGSRYALCLSSLDPVDETLFLEDTHVAVGNSKGRPGSEYVRGRVDKACLELATAVPHTGARSGVHIGLVAELAKPYAVFLRS